MALLTPLSGSVFMSVIMLVKSQPASADSNKRVTNGIISASYLDNQ